MLRSELTDQGQTSRGEEGLLADGGCVGNVGYGDKARGSRVAAEDDVESFLGLEVGCQEREVGVEVGRSGG